MAAIAAALAAQEPSGVIAGSVRDFASKAPLPDVDVVLTAPRFRSKVTTDAEGVFRFEHLPAADYRVGYSKPGYMGSDVYGSTMSVHLPDGAVTERLIIDLPLTAQVEGVVLDEEGRPFPGVMVHAQAGNGPATTDEEGRYHLEVLVPRPARIDLRIPFEIRRKTITRDPATGEVLGYANTQSYPALVDFAPGVHLHGLDIRLRRTRLVSLGGHVTDEQKSTDLEIELSPDGAPLPDETYQRRRPATNGAFRFDLIEPGHYTLLVFRGSGRDGLPYVTTIHVPTAGLEDLKVTVPAFAQIRGLLSTARPGLTILGPVKIILWDPEWRDRGREFVAEGDREFSLDGVPPGHWRFDVRPTKPLTVGSVRFGSQQLPDPFLVAESGNPPLEITLTDQAGTVAGTVVDEHQQPVGGALIVLRQPGDSSILGKLFRSGGDGSFRASDLAPGTYEVTAWKEGRPGIDPPPKGIDRVSKVEVKPGETAVVRLVVDLR
jgi:hypothetical protein